MKTLLKLEDLISIGTWNRRYREMQELVHESPEARTLVVNALTAISLKKDLSYGERKMMDLAMNYDAYKKEHEEKVTYLEKYKSRLGRSD